MSIRSKIITAIAGLTLVAVLAPVSAVAYTGIPAGFTFTKNLPVGTVDQDVVNLKVVLTAEGCGVGITNTTYYGPKTLANVQCFQNKYKTAISAFAGYTIAATGLVGTGTRAQLNVLISGTTTPTAGCPAGAIYNSVTGVLCATTTPGCPAGAIYNSITGSLCPTTPVDGVEVGEGTLTIKLKATPVNLTKVREEETKAVMAFELKAKDASVNVQRIDFVFAGVEDDAEEPISIWKYVTYIALYDGANPVVGVDAVRSAFTKLESGDYEDYYQLRLSGLNISIPKGSTKTLTLKVTAVGAVAEDTEIVAIIPEEGVRGIDASGLTVYIPETGDDVIQRAFVVSTEAEGNIDVSVGADSPETGLAFVDEDDVTEDIPVLVFDIKAKTTDVEINEITVELTDVSDVVSGVKLYSGTTLLDSVTPVDGVAEFTDLEIAIAKNATKSLTVKVDVVAAGEDSVDVPEGTEIAVADLGDIVYTDANDMEWTVDDDDDDVPGETMYLYTVAPVMTLTSTSIALVPNETNPGTEASGQIVFTVKAQGGTIYIDQDASVTIDSQTGDTTATGDDLISNATLTGGNYIVNSGQTKTFTLNFYIDEGNNAFDGAVITGLVWGTTAGADEQEFGTTLLENFKTNRIYIKSL